MSRHPKPPMLGRIATRTGATLLAFGLRLNRGYLERHNMARAAAIARHPAGKGLRAGDE